MRCDCCDLPIESCGREVEKRQRAEARAERARLLALPGAASAQFAGVCGHCGEHFDAGTPIIGRRDPIGHRTPLPRHRTPLEPNGGPPSRWRSLLCCPPKENP